LETPPAKPIRVDPSTFRQGISYLAGVDPDLAQVIARFGVPPMWQREPGFPTLVYLILEQQVSLASAKAAYTRLVVAAGELTPARFLEFTDAELKAIGFSRQKAAYCRGLSRAVLDGELDLDGLQTLDDEAARARLIAIKGIGRWTADNYLLMAMLRPDVWPAGDLALAAAVQRVKGLASRPGPVELEAIADPWRPWRAVAARVLWHFYLSEPG
jgi:DNA-3-methyladenine glycosylase II